MNLPPYMRASTCPTCRHGVYVQAEEYDKTSLGGRVTRALRPLDAPLAGAPAVMTGCGCGWVVAAVKRALPAAGGEV